MTTTARNKNGLLTNLWKKKGVPVLVIFIMLLAASCKKFVSIDPPITQITTSTVYASDATATAAISGIYSQMIGTTSFASGGLGSVTVMTALSADELINYSPSQDYLQFYTNAINPVNNSVLTSNLWLPMYSFIYQANLVHEGLSRSTALTVSTRSQLMGEALFLRAFCNFYLVNLFGDVPLVTSTDYRQNKNLSRASKTEVFSRIIDDLKEAQGLLNDDYSFTAGERVRPNQWAATALLARAFLYAGQYANAEAEASKIINNSSLYNLLPDPNAVFLKNSREAIWQLKPVSSTRNTNEGELFIFNGTPGRVSLSNQVMTAFETGDQRKAKWTGTSTGGSSTYFFPYKYKVASSSALTEYSMVLRVAEQYLIRSEARAKQANISGALDDLNAIRNRAGLSNFNAVTESAVLDALVHERQVELFTEWGHRWLDVKRMGKVDQVMTSVTPMKGGIWNTTQQLYPIPHSERLNDPNLTQNPGY
ncbi:MAG TPA: RagB/SusD family nutrient uptake outer membrane protein [Flavisolibacter sp.]|nr:RagB/SusD family nutrient uptake outer membrane protein [Flavisolibacter sp.]HWJ89773.1 RagB/SusD family nutrient uptake outer membrane protein [Flavisolibacter sp.]